jgi:hypothetical protein
LQVDVDVSLGRVHLQAGQLLLVHLHCIPVRQRKGSSLNTHTHLHRIPVTQRQVSNLNTHTHLHCIPVTQRQVSSLKVNTQKAIHAKNL